MTSFPVIEPPICVKMYENPSVTRQRCLQTFPKYFIYKIHLLFPIIPDDQVDFKIY